MQDLFDATSRWGRRSAALLAAPLLALSGAFPAAAETPAELDSLLECMRAQLPDQTVAQRVELESKSDDGGRSEELAGRLHLQTAEEEGQRLLRLRLRIDWPDYLSGASYLLREGAAVGEDAMYIWLPAVRRTRQIIGDFATAPLLGSYFSYDDLRTWQGLFGGADVEWLGPVKDAPADEARLHRLRLKPEPSARSAYDRVDITVDSQRCLLREADFITDGRAVKQLRVAAEDVAELDGFHYAKRVVMYDRKQKAHSELRVLDVQLVPSPPTEWFDPLRFHLHSPAEPKSDTKP